LAVLILSLLADKDDNWIALADVEAWARKSSRSRAGHGRGHWSSAFCTRCE